MSEIPLSITALGDPYVRLWEQFSEFPTCEEVSERIRIFKPRSLANFNCKGRGPAGCLVFVGKVCYPRDQVILCFASLGGQSKSRKPHTPEPESTATASSEAERE